MVAGQNLGKSLGRFLPLLGKLEPENELMESSSHDQKEGRGQCGNVAPPELDATLAHQTEPCTHGYRGP